MVAAIRDFPEGAGGVLHCFTGSDRLLEAGLERGLYISVTGIITFGSFQAGHQVRTVPSERLMVETDSPYLAPVPLRGRRNEPAFVRHVAETVARLRNETFEQVAAYTTENARRFYGIG
jgi:TatD DNase family protein